MPIAQPCDTSTRMLSLSSDLIDLLLMGSTQVYAKQEQDIAFMSCCLDIKEMLERGTTVGSRSIGAEHCAAFY